MVRLVWTKRAQRLVWMVGMDGSFWMERVVGLERAVWTFGILWTIGIIWLVGLVRMVSAEWNIGLERTERH